MPSQVHSVDAVRRRVLASAYACEPGRGSEPGIGWNWARQIALNHELTLITRVNNVEAIQSAAAAESLRIEVVGHDLPPSLRWWKRGSRGAMAYYYLWQKSLADVAAERVAGGQFEIAHHLTFASGWISSGLAHTGLPFVFGPVGEHPRVPSRFLRGIDMRSHAAEWARATARQCLPRVDSDVRATWKNADVILSLGSTFEGHLADEFQDRVMPMLACGTDLDAFSEPRGRVGNEPLRILFAGRLLDLKGVRLALEAFALAKSEVNATLEIVGEGAMRTHLERTARSLGIEESVTFRGELDHADTLAAMRNAHMFLFPSFEGGGMVVPEAMASGCCVVCLAYGGPGEMVGRRRGLAVPLEDSLTATASEVAKEIARLAADDGRRVRIAEEGQEWARRTTTWDAKGRRLSAIYSRAIEHRNASHGQANAASGRAA